MARKPDEIEQEIRQKRQEISQRINEVTFRTSRDADEVASRLKHIVEGVDFKRTLSEHPLTSIAGALGLGITLGLASEGITGSASRPDAEKQPFQHQQDKQGTSPVAAGLLSTLVYQLEGAVVQEGRQLIHEWLRPRKNGSSASDTSGPTQMHPPVE